MRLPDTLRDELRIPLGVLVPDAQADAVTISAHIVDAPCVITVGDRTTEKLIGFGIVPNLQIVDCMERRSVRDSPQVPAGTVVMSCVNPAAEITADSISKIREALASRTPVRLTVQGEEDLLAIPACVLAPEGSVVLYGQPSEGIVIVRIDDDARRKTQTLLDAMDSGNDETVAG